MSVVYVRPLAEAAAAASALMSVGRSMRATPVSGWGGFLNTALLVYVCPPITCDFPTGGMNPLDVETFCRNAGLPLTVRLSLEWTRPQTVSPVIQKTPFSRLVIQAKREKLLLALLASITSTVSR